MAGSRSRCWKTCIAGLRTRPRSRTSSAGISIRHNWSCLRVSPRQNYLYLNVELSRLRLVDLLSQSHYTRAHNSLSGRAEHGSVEGQVHISTGTPLGTSLAPG